MPNCGWPEDKLTSKRAGRAADRDRSLVAPRVMLLANLLKRSGNIIYARELGLSAIEWSIIARVGEEGPMTQTEIVDMALLDKAQVSRAAVGLAEKGLIVRNSRTWRSIEIVLSPAGRKVCAAITRISRKRHRQLTLGVSPRDLELLFQTLEAIEKNAQVLLRSMESLPPGRRARSRQ